MLYIVWAVIIAMAVVLGIFTGIWGGLVWIFAAVIVTAAIFMVRARGTTVERPRTAPTGTPHASSGSAETANERVGQS